MRTRQIVLIALSAIAVVAVVWTIASNAEVALNEPGTELLSVNVFGAGNKTAPPPAELSAQRREK